MGFISLLVWIMWKAQRMVFFSSRRRHTRWTGDWSSDVCSSDLALPMASKLSWASAKPSAKPLLCPGPTAEEWMPIPTCLNAAAASAVPVKVPFAVKRSEERRVGKECRCQRATDRRDEKTYLPDR